MKRTISPISPLVIAVLALSGCVFAPPFYWAESIHGRVVDADTGEPIEGTVVIADWKLYGGGMGHGGHRNSLLVKETLTDANGEFSFGKWGPKMRPAWEILDKGPRLVVLKSNYTYANLWNEADSNWFVRGSHWDGKTIRLKKFAGTSQARINSLNSLLFVSPPPPLMLREILKEESLYPTSRGGSSAFFQHIKELLVRAERAAQ